MTLIKNISLATKFSKERKRKGKRWREGRRGRERERERASWPSSKARKVGC
jgi:hypothetical protein